jgi:hypothetical protein
MSDSRTAGTDARLRYEHEMRRRLRYLDVVARLRAFTMQVVWIIVLAAGAAVPLATALEWDDWVAPVLGFVVVVASGVERIFNRTTAAAVAVDALRRRLDRERRVLVAGQLEYADADDPLGVYVERSEDAIAEFDRTMIDYGQQVAVRPDE